MNCQVCKQRPSVATHHTAPREYFGDEADLWPKIRVCEECHRRWHSVMPTLNVTHTRRGIKNVARFSIGDNGEVIERIVSDTITVTLIYTTKPSVRMLALVKDPSDAAGLVQQKLSAYIERKQADEEQQAERGGTVRTEALERWKDARWIEIELDIK